MRRQLAAGQTLAFGRCWAAAVAVIGWGAACSTPPAATAADAAANAATDTADVAAVFDSGGATGDAAGKVDSAAGSEASAASDAAVAADAAVAPDAMAADALADATTQAPDAQADFTDVGAGDLAAPGDTGSVDAAAFDVSADASGADAAVDSGLDPADTAVPAPDNGPVADAVAADVPVVLGMAGCSDGSREGFLDKKKYPLAAACGGAWSVPGVHKGTPACGRQAGNTGTNSSGTGCNVEDLCAEGWHVCYGAKDLKERNPEGCGGILDGTAPAGGPLKPAFFLARTSSTGAFNCSQDSTKFGSPATSDDLFGCGNLGCGVSFASYPSCDPLDRASHDLCKGLRNDLGVGDWCAHLGKFPTEKNTWNCGKSGTNEANAVVKSDPAVQGGVLCCADSGKPLP